MIAWIESSIFGWIFWYDQNFENMKIAFILLLLTSSFNLLGQHSTMRFSDSPINLNNQSLLLVPFKSQMYLSDINKDLAEHNQLNTNEIVERFTAAVDQSIYYTFREKSDVSSFYALEDESSEKDLRYIFSSLRLEYELVDNTKDQTQLKKFSKKFKKKEDSKYQRGAINNGQITSKRDDRERYMKAVVEDKKMLDSMHTKFNNKFFLFVNQLDIKNKIGETSEMEQMKYEREIKLHYTLYHVNGEILSTGISVANFPATLNDINLIIKNYFPILAVNIYNDLYEIEPSEKDQKSKLNSWK